MIKMWSCPKCKRKFARKNQSHSCKIYPVSKHFSGRPYSKKLYSNLLSKIRKIANFKIESLPCCIHLVTSFTFAAVLVFKSKLAVHFTLDHKLKKSRISTCIQMSKTRYLHSVEIKNQKEIDKELLLWLKESAQIKQPHSTKIRS